MHASRSQRHPLPLVLRRALVWLTGALCVAAVLVGVLSMHSTGIDHQGASVSSTGAAQPTTAAVGAAGSFVAPPAGPLHCDEACMESVIECAVAIATCAALLLLVGFATMLRRPNRRWSGLRAALMHPSFTLGLGVGASRPDLDLLSISRT